MAEVTRVLLAAAAARLGRCPSAPGGLRGPASVGRLVLIYMFPTNQSILKEISLGVHWKY